MNRLPNIPERFFLWYCNPDLQEQILGDLEEQFDEDISTHGLRKARRKFAWNVLRFCRRSIIRPMRLSTNQNHLSMFKNYLKISWRNILRQKLYSSINIGGLATGITAFMLISIYVQHENSYDRHYPNADNIFNIYQEQEANYSLGTNRYAVTPAALPSTLQARYPEVRSATTLDIFNTLIEVGNERYVEDALFADEHYFDVFQHSFLRGKANTALANKTGAVLTASFARKLFGTENPMGKKIVFWGNREAFVTGVIEDLPSNTTLKFSCILSIKNSNYYLQERAKTAWNGNSYYTFFTLDEQTDVASFEVKIQQILEDHWASTSIPSTYLVSPLQDLHLRTRVNEDIGVKGNARQMKTFSIIAIVVLILASINYMNLAIARSIRRAKEVGLRKAIGAAKTQLISQFLTESIALSMIALFLSFGLLQLITPLFGRLVERELDLLMMLELNLIPITFLVVVLIGLISGSYPAFFMSSLRPYEVFKKKIQLSGPGNGIQKLLIILQYTISIIMITMSLIIYLQMDFINHKELGFQKDQILTYQLRSGINEANIRLIGDQFASNSLTSQFTFSSSLPTDIQSSTFLTANRTAGNIYRLYTDSHFDDLYELKLLSGRFLEAYDGEEDFRYVINESAAKALGWSAVDAVGKEFVNEGGERKTIIGVVKDFHMHSMHMPVAPLMIGVREYRPYISVKVNPEHIASTIEYMEEVISPFTSYPFEFQFVDDKFEALYREDTRQAEVFGFFTILSILIASLGLFGLAAFSVRQRTKEIGIRKVLGATVTDIVLIFSRSFMGLVGIAFILTIPIAWFFSTEWLQSFSYRINISWWVFLVAGTASSLLAFATISSQSIKASLVNPVESLKDE